MPYIFNDLSLNSHIDTPDKFIAKINEILSFAEICKRYHNIFYLHQNGIYASLPCNISFRSCVNANCNRELRSSVLSLIDKNTPSLPAESAIPDGLCFYHTDDEISSTGLAECAYQNFMDEDEIFKTFSISNGGYDLEQLTIAIHDAESTNLQKISNVYSLEKLQYLCENSQGSISSWEDMIERAALLDLIRIEGYVLVALARAPFCSSLAESVLRLLKVLSRMISTSSDGEFKKLFSDYCMRSNTHFSDESQTKIDDYESELTFKVHGEKKVCSYHGKIKGSRQFRIHMDECPSRGNERTIVYIGYKITKD